MTRREAYYAALRRQPTDQLIWAANFDHWYAVNMANGTLPTAYADLSNNDVHRAVGDTIWRRVVLAPARLDETVIVTQEDQGETILTHFQTPAGTISTRHQQAPDSSKAWFLMEHRVKRFEDLAVLAYLTEHTTHVLDDAPYHASAAEVGEDGIVLTYSYPVPFIEFAKIEVGYGEAYYLMADYPDETAALLELLEAKYLEAYRLLAGSACPLITNGDNMDQLTCPPHYFHRYAVPYYRKVAEILHAGGKIAQGHWCGKLDTIIPEVPGCGLDAIEAVTPKPMTGVDMAECMDLLEGKIAVQGGLPSVFMCEEGCTRDELLAYTRTLLDAIGHRRGFILGMGDNVPPNADFDRVRMITDLVEEYNTHVRPGRVE
jgi:hypothetical protein